MGELAPVYEADHDDDHGECWNCGGEGFIEGCSWDWQCETYDSGAGMCHCTRRCDFCGSIPSLASEASTS